MNMMRRLLYVLTALLLTGAALVSCDDDETYAEQRQKERDAISAFLNRDVYICNSAGDVLIHVGKINIISEDVFNAQGQVTNVDRNEYVVFENTGVYMQIVRKGVGTKLQNKETATILCRFIEVNLRGDSIQASNQNSYTTAIPDVMTVSNTLGTFTGSFVSGIMYSYYGASVPSGWLVPLSYVNIGRQETPDEKIAKVRLIVPDSQGQKNASENVYACFYDITYQRGYR